MKETSLSVISLFSGAGGLDLGFKNAGFKTMFATDNWDIACECLKENNLSSYIEKSDIGDLNLKNVISGNSDNEIDCLIGGPPCPPYSKSRFYLKDKPRALSDSDGMRTLMGYVNAIREIRPKTFLFENVHGFIYKPHLQSLTFLQSEANKMGYRVTWQVLNSADYGVPQIRQRFIMVGVLNSLPEFTFPKRSHYNPNRRSGYKQSEQNSNMKLFDEAFELGIEPWVTAGQVINHLDYDISEDVNMLAGSKHKDLLPLIPPGDNYLYLTKKRGYPDPKFEWRSRYWSFLLKLSPDLPSWTIQASFSNNMGPFHWKNRFLRIQEIKRLQTFPDSFILPGTFRDKWRLIGNAVPPLLAEKIAYQIKDVVR